MPQRRAGAWCLVVLAALAALPACSGTRPTPDVSAPGGLRTGGLAAPQFPSQDGSRGPYNRRLLLMSQAEGTATVLEPEAAAVALMWAPQLEAVLAELAASGLRLSPSEQLHQSVVDTLVADAEALADEVIALTRSEIAALVAKLMSSIPQGTSAAAMATLLHTTDFNAKLKGAVDDAVVLVSGAMEPHLEVVAQTVHSALGQLVVEPGALDPLPAFSDAFLPNFVDKFSLNVVEATLLHSLWQDA